MLLDSTRSVEDCHAGNYSAGLPDSVQAEMAEAFPSRHGDYTPAEEAEMYAQYMARIGAATMGNADGGDRNPTPPTPPAAPAVLAALLAGDEPDPFLGSRFYVEEIARGLSDLALIAVIDRPDLTTISAAPELVEDVYSAELVRRIAERQCSAELPKLSDDALALVIEGADDVEDPFDFGPAAPLILDAASAELDRRMQLRADLAA